MCHMKQEYQKYTVVYINFPVEISWKSSLINNVYDRIVISNWYTKQVIFPTTLTTYVETNCFPDQFHQWSDMELTTGRILANDM